MEESTQQRYLHLSLLISLLLLLAKSTAQAQPTRQAYTDFITTSCTKITLYPQLCISSLSAHATSIQSSPRKLANAALVVALSTTRATSSSVSSLSRAHNMTPRQAGAVNDCLHVLGDSVQELRASLTQMAHLRGPGFAFHMSNVQTWVSAALTDDSTCTDGFEEGDNGDIEVLVRDKIVKIVNLTSNALALVNSYASQGPLN